MWRWRARWVKEPRSRSRCRWSLRSGRSCRFRGWRGRNEVPVRGGDARSGTPGVRRGARPGGERVRRGGGGGGGGGGARGGEGGVGGGGGGEGAGGVDFPQRGGGGGGGVVGKPPPRNPHLPH